MREVPLQTRTAPANKEQLEKVQGLSPESQCQNLAFIVSCAIFARQQPHPPRLGSVRSMRPSFK